MQKGFLNSLSPGAKIVFSIIFALFSMLVVSLLGILPAGIIFEMSIDEILQNLREDKSDNISLLKYYQILQSIGLFILPALFLGRMFFEKNFPVSTMKSKNGLSIYFWVAAMIFFGFPLINYLGEWNSGLRLPEFMAGIETKIRSMEETAELLTKMFLDTHTISGLIVNLIMIAVLPAIGEELFFRGVIQRIFIEWTNKAWLGILLGALLFSFMHFQFYGFIPRFYLGVIFGFIYFWTGSIWISIFAHFLNNAFFVVIYFFHGSEKAGTGIEIIEEPGGLIMILVGIIVTSLAFWEIYSKNKIAENISDDISV
ncbi:MAG: CPBP family intramembrane metalloprotease [Bacteroidales bacterium]|nr:CPBP family intramembrane metalloprotease [Bacteroidales bacterium]